MEAKTLLAAVREHLLLPGESLATLRAQWHTLTEKDKRDLREYFAAAAITDAQEVGK